MINIFCLYYVNKINKKLVPKCLLDFLVLIFVFSLTFSLSLSKIEWLSLRIIFNQIWMTLKVIKWIIYFCLILKLKCINRIDCELIKINSFKVFIYYLNGTSQ